MRRIVTTLLLILIMLPMHTGCDDVGTPKPMGYFRITLPEHSYIRYEEIGKPFVFEHSKTCKVVNERIVGKASDWINLYYPTLNCNIHLTYLHLAQNDEEQAYEDSHKLVYKHSVMADAIGERYFDNAEIGVYATLYDIKGNAASPTQFAITDSAGRFFRGSLYFSCKPNKDSLAPVVDYVNEEIIHLIETFEWNK